MPPSLTSFPSSSKETPGLLSVSFASDPTSGLGAQLVNLDKPEEQDSHMFSPGFATIGRVLPGETIARRAGLSVGDIIVAVNGKGFRRFAPDFKPEEASKLNEPTPEDPDAPLDNRVLAPGTAYDQLLAHVKQIKSAGDPPLYLSLERYGWDARPNSWSRFLAARDGVVPDAMLMCQEHERWRAQYFPVDMTAPGLQRILKAKAIADITVDALHEVPPTLYINYGSLVNMQAAGEITSEDIVAAFVIFTERMCKKSKDPRNPRTSQFIDLSEVSITSGFRVESLKKIYSIFEPNYPEILSKMVMYPVSTMLGSTARTLLSFVNERTQNKFLITNDMEQVCTELGWDKDEVEVAGSISKFVEKHESMSTLMVVLQD